MAETIFEIGFEGEKVIREYLTSKNIKYFQADILAKVKEKWYLIEVKKQEAFEPPPFKGHGLPAWQMEARLKFQEETGIRTMLFVIDKKTNVIYWQYMDILKAGKSTQTSGKYPRIIFPIDNYKVLNT